MQLGPFRLLSPIGRGGMGQVWLGEHPDTGRRVAVKVLTERKVTDRRFRRAFRNEARAVAALEHPHIVEVYDYGEIPAEAAAASQRRLVAGAPYLVMELVGGGTLSQRRGRMSWTDLRAALQALLDALAHAHARNVVHRDLKPGNVLYGDGSGGVKLTDFGLAHAINREGVTLETSTNAVGGTPAYMAPEQFYGSNRDVGPWSDLYALGCLVYSMVHGDPPFGRKPWMEVANGHLYGEPPPLRPQFPVPDGFEPWVRRLLAKDVNARYRRAADAAWDLADLEDPTEELLRPVPLPLLPLDQLARAGEGNLEDTLARLTAGTAGSDESAVQSRPLDPGSPTMTTLVWNRDDAPRPPRVEPDPTVILDEPTVSAYAPISESPTRPEPPPLPFSWRRPERVRPPSRLLGTGLYDLRTIPMVDREEERELLWRALRQSRRRGRAYGVVVQGAAGCGKTRLAEWLCQRAHELGAANILQAAHSPMGSRSDGLVAMLLRYLRCAGLDRVDTVQRLTAQLDALDVTEATLREAVMELLAPATESERASGIRPLRLQSSAERHVVIRRLLEHVSRERPLVLWLDDVQWGLDALEFTQHLLEVQDYGPVPALVLLTVRDEALPPRSAEASLIGEILADPQAERLSLGPLPLRDRQALIRELLGLEPELAARVEERTQGNPQFAVRLVGDWVERGLLQRTGAGFRLAPGAEVQLPDDLHEAWGNTVAQLLDTRPPSDGVALELAAVLGRDVVVREWNQACQRAGARPSAGLVDALLGRRLVHASDPEHEWSFAHEMLRESLLRRARDGGRWQAHHRICAAMLSDGGADSPDRIARHLVEAGEREAALEPMLEAGRLHVEQGAYRAARVLLADRERILEGLAPPPSDVRWSAGWVMMARLFRQLHSHAEALEWSRRAVEAARLGRHGRVLLDALREQGVNALIAGEAEAAEGCITEGLSLAAALADPRKAAELTSDLGFVRIHHGDLAAAERTFLDAIERYRLIGDEAAAAQVYMGLCDVARKSGRYDRAIDWTDEARRCFEAQGARSGVAVAIHNRADVLRLRGDAERGDLYAAEVGLREALARFEELGVGRQSVARVNLALVLVARGRHEEARLLLERYLAENGEGRSTITSLIHAALAACTAGLRDWPALDRHLGRAIGLAERVRFVDPDLGELLERAGELARRAGQVHRARLALGAAEAQWARLERAEDLSRVRRILGLLPG